MKWFPLTTLALSLSFPLAAHADWAKTEADAKGQTVYFNAWGGSEATNAYIGWVGQQVKSRYGVELRHVKVTDTAEVVKRVQTEVAAGRRTDGSVDLMWINGENFRNLKQGGLLFGPWSESLPNWGAVDLNKPVRSDFSVPTDGYEAPWGTAQLTFIARPRSRSPARSIFITTVADQAKTWCAPCSPASITVCRMKPFPRPARLRPFCSCSGSPPPAG